MSWISPGGPPNPSRVVASTLCVVVNRGLTIAFDLTITHARSSRKPIGVTQTTLAFAYPLMIALQNADRKNRGSASLD